MFKVKVERNLKKWLDRQVKEFINNFANSDRLNNIQMNSKLDFHTYSHKNHNIKKGSY